MALPTHAVTLSPERIAELDRQLSEFRHNVNNHLGLIIATAELIRMKPESAERVLESMMRQPERIGLELKGFSSKLMAALEITEES